MENLIDELQKYNQNYMGLEHGRRELIVDPERVKIVIEDKAKTRANWLDIQELNERRELEMGQLRQQQMRDLEYSNARNN